jgi:hypothetical protein
MNGVGIEFVALQRVGMIVRIQVSILNAIDLIADALCQGQKLRRIGGHGLEVQIELPQQVVGSWRGRGNPIAGRN